MMFSLASKLASARNEGNLFNCCCFGLILSMREFSMITELHTFCMFSSKSSFEIITCVSLYCLWILPVSELKTEEGNCSLTPALEQRVPMQKTHSNSSHVEGATAKVLTCIWVFRSPSTKLYGFSGCWRFSLDFAFSVPLPLSVGDIMLFGSSVRPSIRDSHFRILEPYSMVASL